MEWKRSYNSFESKTLDAAHIELVKKTNNNIAKLKMDIEDVC